MQQAITICGRRAGPWPALLVFCLLALIARVSPARAAPTAAGVRIDNTAAQIAGNAGGHSVTATSGTPAAYTVSPFFGLNMTAGPGSNQNNVKTVENGYADYTVSVKNAGNAPGTMRIRVSVASAGGAAWSFQVDDAATFTTPLPWQGGGTTFTSSSETSGTAAAAAKTPQNAFATFTVRVSPVSGAGHGATLTFDVLLLTGDSPVGAFTGFNAVNYGGPSSLAIARKTAVAPDSTPPAAAISSPAAGAALSGMVSISGSAFEPNFASYTLYYGPGTAPAAWGIFATSSTPVTSGVLGTWNTRDLFGTYTIRLRAVDTSGNAAEQTVSVRVINSSSLAGSVPKDRWTMMSFPGVPSSRNPRTIFGSAINYEVQQWDPADTDASDYLRQYQLTFPLETAGEGFWVKPYGNDLPYNVNMSFTDTTREYAMPLKAGWNQVGCPYNRPEGMQWGNVKVKNKVTGEVVTLTEANARGWMDADLNEYVNNTYVSRGAGTVMPTLKAYFLKAYIDVDLLFDPREGRGAVARIVRPKYEWKLDLAAETAGARDAQNSAAALAGAAAEYDPADSGEPPTVEPYVSLYFDNSDWKRNAGRYKEDSRPPASVGTETAWFFTVETSETGKPVTVSVAATSVLPYNYSFVMRDEETGAEFDPKQAADYSYTDDGTGRRRFSLRATKTAEAGTVSLARDFPPGWSLFSVPLEPVPTEVRAQLGDDLKTVQVFQYYDSALYEPDSPERVDLQAGIGYWIHLDETTKLDFAGEPTDENAPVEIPLAAGWNLIGNPYTAEITFGEGLLARRAGETVTLQQAMDAGWLAREIYGFNNETGGFENHGAETPMSPWKGYAVKALQPCTLIVRTTK